MTRKLDITRDVCPMTTVKVGMALALLAPGESLEVRLREEALRNVIAALKADGHRIAATASAAGDYVLKVASGCLGSGDPGSRSERR